ncbi:MAG: hypothetical protein U5M23_13570 [Marinagarivorans sp.]|nr:hypothetical protein [Marinagarivorans sp.]
MSHLWNTLLHQASFSQDPITEGVIVLTEHVIITATGVQAVGFLQGQCTCDFKPLAEREWLLGAHCNANGRMQSSFVAAQLAPDCVALRVHHSIAEAAVATLQKYAALSRVKCEISTYVAVAIVGNTLQNLPANALNEHQFCLEQDALWLKHNPKLTEVWFKSDNQLWTQLSQQPLWSANEWQRLMIENGIAEVQQATADQHIPQEFNYDLINGVNFKKGCYTGQEIIARVHYKGQSKKRLYRLVLSTSSRTKVSVGSAIVNAEGKVLGNLVAAAIVAEGYEVLACLPRSSLIPEAAERLYLEAQMACALTQLALPYAIP